MNYSSPESERIGLILGETSVACVTAIGRTLLTSGGSAFIYGDSEDTLRKCTFRIILNL